MASSSVSQESLDTVDFEQSARKSKIRSLRAKGVLPRSNERDVEPVDRDQNGDDGFSGDHESPSRGGVARMKDKRNRPSHLHKGKMGLKDKRKLREKRRSTGVVHLQSTEVNTKQFIPHVYRTTPMSSVEKILGGVETFWSIGRNVC